MVNVFHKRGLKKAPVEALFPLFFLFSPVEPLMSKLVLKNFTFSRLFFEITPINILTAATPPSYTGISTVVKEGVK